MKLFIVTGSHRKEGESGRVGEYIKGRINALGHTGYHYSLAENPLPLWDESVWEGAEKWKQVWGPVSDELKSSDGLVVVSPEWAGMVPSGLKNFFLLCSNAEVANKPAMIVGVSSGISGSYPIAELRTSSYKNNHLCYIPDHVIIRNVGDMLKGDVAANERDKGVRDRIEYSLKMLVEYAKALKAVRESGVPNHKDYPFGM